MFFWRYVSDKHARAGALPPEPLALEFGRQRPDSPQRLNDFAERWRRIEAGERIVPSDCPPVRAIARYGFTVRCPVPTTFRRLETPSRHREFDAENSRFGQVEVGGAEWPGSDSLRAASWIAGSEYVKVQSGVLLYFPRAWLLYQGPLPNGTLLPDRHHGLAMAGLEFAIPRRLARIGDDEFGVAELNGIFRLPALGEVVRIERGQPLCWIFAVPGPGVMTLAPLPTGLE